MWRVLFGGRRLFRQGVHEPGWGEAGGRLIQWAGFVHRFQSRGGIWRGNPIAHDRGRRRLSFYRFRSFRYICAASGFRDRFFKRDGRVFIRENVVFRRHCLRAERVSRGLRRVVTYVVDCFKVDWGGRKGRIHLVGQRSDR